MANCINLCTSDPLGDYELPECTNDPVGGMSAVIWLECDHQLTESDFLAGPVDLGTAINAEITAGRAHLVERCSFTLEAASEVTQDSLVPCEVPSLVTYERSGNYINPNVTQTNITFHNNLFDGRNFGGVIAYECGYDDSTETKYVTWVDASVKVTGSRIVPSANTEFQRFEGVAKWKSKYNPQRYEAPTGVFFQ